MTASLPVPNDIDPEEPDRHSSARVVPLSSGGRDGEKSVSMGDGEASATHTPPAPRPKRKPRAQPRRKPAAPDVPAPQPDMDAPAPAATAPGPEVSSPSDLDLAASAAAGIVVPPKPPLPDPQSETAAGPAAEPTDAGPATEAVPATEVEPTTEAEVVPEIEVEPEGEPPTESEPTTGSEPESEPPTEPETDQLADAEPDSAEQAGEPEPGLEAEPDAGASSAPAAVPASDALVLRGVTKRFGSTHAVDGIDLTVPAGTFYGLVGPNGAGKTTTLSMIAGLLDPDRGTIRVGGVDASADPRGAKKLMGVLPDRLRTFDRLTGRQLLHYYGVLRGLPPAVVESRTVDLARAFDLGDALGRRVSDYSAGMLKKVMLAGALIHSPRLLVLDEPFEAVDPVSSAIILDILSTYVAHGGTVILSSHGMELVERVCTRVAVIVAGQVLAEGTVAEVRGELTLEQRFVELAGGLSDVEGLEWLHTFSS